MDGRRFILLLAGVVTTYFVAAGGTAAIIDGDIAALAEPLLSGSPLDLALFMIAIVLVGSASMPLAPTEDLRSAVLTGVGLGSALVVTLCLALTIHGADAFDPQLLGTLTLVSLCQAFVGIAAGAMLLLRHPSRRRAYAPLLLNTSFAVIATLVLIEPWR